ncbi:conserved hypothetical protein-signal peptide and transmembrane prediction [Roseibacterium elongatum DSM 19469]|uniref:Uncharacterized protein n=1 Tax=Roseicyclus elongatus DSM 19469 TaxID=1294273 RepID=W8RSB3_9RHOB|nr:hypothetical protein [Roseibacterium elongatum]AHM04059.1 conserved hypothetical protein-signal peptide and transmembrane prediction [Roseibacterium elongatum DSM 19469]
MSRFGKFPIFALLIALAALAAALFGALHNQISYSVGPSYFTDFKFTQFGTDPQMAPRLAAALVGAQASWWVGALVALPAFLFGLVAVPRNVSYFAAGIGAIGLVVVLATFAAIAGMLGGIIVTATGWLEGAVSLPEGVDRAEFLRAGFMHDASTIGAGLGAILAFWPMRRARQIDAMRHARQEKAPNE